MNSATDHRHLTGPVALALAETCWGTALLLAPGPLLGSFAGQAADHRLIDVTRVLGARQLAQGLVTARRSNRGVLQLGAAVDALHATTMLAAAMAGLGPRRLTLASAAVAGAFSAAGTAQSRRR